MEELETIDDRPCSSNGLPHGVLRVEIDTGHELYVRLFVPDPEKREIELSFRGDVASSLLRSFSLGEIPTFLIDLLEMSKVCLFYQGCVALQWDGAVRFLRPSMKTMYSDVRMIRNSVAPQLRRAAENSYWQNIAPPAKKIAFWSPGEQETRSFLLSYSWTRLRQMERNNAMELDRLEAITAAAARAESRGDIRFLSSSARLKLRETSRMGSKQNSLCNMVSTSTAAHPSRSEAPRWVEEATVNCVLDVANMNGTDSLHSHNICSLSNPSAQNDSPLSIVEERWKASKRLNDKRFDGVLFKNVLERDTLNTYEIKVRKDSGYGCWGEFSVRNIDNGVIRTAPFYIGNHTDLSNYLTKTVGFIALRKSDRPLTPHYNVADMLLDS